MKGQVEKRLYGLESETCVLVLRFSVLWCWLDKSKFSVHSKEKTTISSTSWVFSTSCCEGESWQLYCNIRINFHVWPLKFNAPGKKRSLKVSPKKMGKPQSIFAISKSQLQDQCRPIMCFSYTFALIVINLQKRETLFTLGYFELPLETLSSKLASSPTP